MSGTFGLSWGLTALNSLLPQPQVQTLHRWVRVAEEEGAGRVLSHQGDFKTPGQAPRLPPPSPALGAPVPASCPYSALAGDRWCLEDKSWVWAQGADVSWDRVLPFHPPACLWRGQPSSPLAEEGLAGLGGLIAKGHRQSFGGPVAVGPACEKQWPRLQVGGA